MVEVVTGINSTEPAQLNESRGVLCWLRKQIAGLQHPVDGASLAVFRILFGLLMAYEVIAHWHQIGPNYVTPTILMSWVPGLLRLPEPGVYALFGLTALLALCLAAGWRYRITSVGFFVCFLYFFLLEKAYYHNYRYLSCLLAFLLMLTSAQRVWSFDSIGQISRTVPRWNIEVLKVQIVMAYFFSGLGKLSADWLAGLPISYWMMRRASAPFWGSIATQSWFHQLITYGGIGIDLSVGFLLLFRKTFWLGLVAAVSFNVMNSQLLKVGIFPWLMIASISLFAPPNWPRRIWQQFDRRAGQIAHAMVGKERQSGKLPNNLADGWKFGKSARYSNIALMSVLMLFFSIQIALPLRHYFYPGNYLWTSEGYHFSWPMMLRDKQGKNLQVEVLNPLTKEKSIVPIKQYINRQQFAELERNPEMLRGFAHIIADRYQTAHGVRPIVTASVLSSLNFRPYQPLIDSSIDLAREPFTLSPKKWILPLR